MSHTHVAHVEILPTERFFGFIRKTGNPEIPKFPDSGKSSGKCRDVYSIDHFLWQTTLPMTGQTGDPKSLNSPEQAPRTRIFRKSRVRKWEISQIRRPPIWHILDISRISRISQKSLLFHRQTPVRTPFPVRSGKIPDLSCQISSTQQISSLFPGFPKNQLVRTRYFDTFPENRRNIDRQRALWHTFSRI